MSKSKLHYVLVTTDCRCAGRDYSRGLHKMAPAEAQAAISAQRARLATEAEITAAEKKAKAKTPTKKNAAEKI